jgi:hypothetical protein
MKHLKVSFILTVLFVSAMSFWACEKDNSESLTTKAVLAKTSIQNSTILPCTPNDCGCEIIIDSAPDNFRFTLVVTNGTNNCETFFSDPCFGNEKEIGVYYPFLGPSGLNQLTNFGSFFDPNDPCSIINDGPAVPVTGRIRCPNQTGPGNVYSLDNEIKFSVKNGEDIASFKIDSNCKIAYID